MTFNAKHTWLNKKNGHLIKRGIFSGHPVLLVKETAVIYLSDF